MDRVWISFTLIYQEGRNHFEVEGILDNGILQFTSPDKETHKLEVSDNVLVYSKIGEANMRFTFDTAKRTKGTYEIMSQTMTFDIDTKQLSRSKGSILVDYDLSQFGATIHNALLTILYRPIQGGNQQ